MEELRKLLEKYMNQDLERLILSSPRKGREEQKVRLRPVLLKGRLKFQAEIFKGPQAFHENMSREEAVYESKTKHTAASCLPGVELGWD